MQEKLHIQFSPTRLKQIKKIALSGSRAKLKILNGKFTEGFQLLKSTAQKFKSFATDLADRIPQALAARISLDLFSHFESKSSKRLGIPKGLVLGGVLALMASLPAVGQTFTNAANEAALITAINTANGDATQDHTIRLEQGSPSTIYTLTGNLPTITNATRSIFIICTGTSNAIIDGNNAHRPITMGINSNLKLSNITIQNGFVANGKGGGVYNNQGDLTISNSLITNNEVTGANPNGKGAGIYSTGNGVAGSASVLIQNSTISLNSASTYGGGVDNRANSLLTISSSSISGNTSYRGGGIFIGNSDNLTISSSSISGNTSFFGGGIYNRESDNIRISHSLVSNNAGWRGGGIFNYAGEYITIYSSSISGNTATSQSGGIHSHRGNNMTISSSSISGNISNGSAGGIFNSTAPNVTIRSSSISGNTSATDGGGIYNKYSSNLTISNSSISGNTSTDNGGGIYNYFVSDNLTISSSSISGNTSGTSGGGIFNYNSANVTIQASSITLNSATTGTGGGVYLYSNGTDAVSIINSTISSNQASVAAGGGIYAKSTNAGNTLSLKHVTISDNSGVGTGGFANDAASTMNITIQNSIIANSTGFDFDVGGAGIIVTASIIESSTSVITSATVIDPLLGALTSNGGFLVHPMQIGSPAIDAGASIGIATDQVGNARVLANPAIGAVEITIAAPPVIINAATTVDLENAITAANMDISDCIINLSGEYVLTSNLPTIIDRTVGGKLEIISTGTTNAVIDGAGLFRPLTMSTGSDLTISNITLTSGSAIKGGGIYNNGGALTITSSTIIDNIGQTGGGVYAINSASILIKNSIISLNSATSNGGGIALAKHSLLTLSSSSITKNTSNAQGGGVFATDFSSIRIENNYNNNRQAIFENFATGNGGGIALAKNSSLTLSSSSITKNTSNAQGGGVHGINSASILIKNSIISLNSATGSGGGIALDKHSLLTLSSSSITKNTSNSRGGGMFGNNFSSIRIENNYNNNRQAIFENFATGNGGGIALDKHSSLTVSSASITKNTSNAQGGGVHAINSASILIKNSIISLNSATSNGGGIALDKNSSLTLSSSSITKNTSNSRGGGMFATDNVLANISNTIISNNTSNDNGGGIALLDKSIFTITSSSITKNTSNKNGGGIAVSDVGSLLNILTTNLNINTSILDGGGIFSQKSGTIVIGSSTFSGNRSSGNGGGAAFIASSVKIRSSSFRGGWASGRGGGMFSQSANTSSFIVRAEGLNRGTSTNMANNSTNTGNVFLLSSLLSSKLSLISQTIITNDEGDFFNPSSVRTKGILGLAGINRIGSPIEISNSTISGNISGAEGGGIYNDDIPLIITSSSIVENIAATGGGIYNRNANLTLENSTIALNSATNNGGGLYLRAYNSDVIRLTNVTISKNETSTATGGGIYAKSTGGSNTLTLEHVTIASNSGTLTGGLANDAASDLTITLKNTIIGNNIGADFFKGTASIDAASVTNLVESGLSHPSVDNSDPLLGDLTLNAGFLVHPLQDLSLAVGKGTNIGVANDQLGSLRANPPSMGAVELTIASSVCMVVTAPAGVTNTWIGCVNSDWSNAANWSALAVPVASDVVYVPLQAVNQLVIDEAATCAKMVVQIGAKCLVNYNAGGKLLIKF
jgi:hypothetical protein